MTGVNEPRPHRPPTLSGETREIVTGCGSLYVTITYDIDGPREVFVNMGKAGGCASASCESIGRLITLCLRYHVPAESIIKQMRGIRCLAPNHVAASCSDAIAVALAEHLELPVEFGIEHSVNEEDNETR